MKELYERLKDYEPLFGTYLLDGKIGEGGFGAVYRLRHRFDEKSKSVVKVITIPDDNVYRNLRIKKRAGEDTGPRLREIIEKCRQEIEFLERFGGQSNIVDIKNYDIKEADEIKRDILIQMEYLTDLHRYAEEHDLDENDVIKIGVDICTALEEIQKYNVIHRDIKPQNIFISPSGHYKLGDFGIAKNVNATVATMTGVGTPLYISPEVYNKEKVENGDKKVDMYSLGLVMYEILSGWQLPFEDELEREEAITKRLSGAELPKLKNCGKPLNDIVLKACAYKREDRYDNITQMKRDLQAVSEGGTVLVSAVIKPREISAGVDFSNFSSFSNFSKDGNDEGFRELLENAMQDQVWAQNNLGNRYYNGEGVAKNYEKAVYWYTKAAEQGNAVAQNNLGGCYYDGEGVAKNYEKAAYWYMKAAEQGHAKAQNNLGIRYYSGEGVAKDYEKAAYWYAKAAEQGHPVAQNWLGACYYNGEGVAKDYVKAAYWFTKAAGQGDAYAQNNLGGCYSDGEGVLKDHEKSVYWYTKAAEQGHAKAQNNLANKYYNGEGAAKNYAKAAYWYAKSAERGNDAAQNNLGDCFYYGNGTARDYAKAFYWFMKSAEQGNPSAQKNLGYCYYNGEGTEKDYAKAVYWYAKSAEQGNAIAQNNLGDCFYYGNGTEKDYAKAVYWFTKAAEQGNAKAQYNLGYCYYNGEGAEKDREKAIFWYKKAAGQGNTNAQEALQKINI